MKRHAMRSSSSAKMVMPMERCRSMMGARAPGNTPRRCGKNQVPKISAAMTQWTKMAKGAYRRSGGSRADERTVGSFREDDRALSNGGKGAPVPPALRGRDEKFYVSHPFIL